MPPPERQQQPLPPLQPQQPGAQPYNGAAAPATATTEAAVAVASPAAQTPQGHGHGHGHDTGAQQVHSPGLALRRALTAPWQALHGRGGGGGLASGGGGTGGGAGNAALGAAVALTHAAPHGHRMGSGAPQQHHVDRSAHPTVGYYRYPGAAGGGNYGNRSAHGASAYPAAYNAAYQQLSHLHAFGAGGGGSAHGGSAHGAFRHSRTHTLGGGGLHSRRSSNLHVSGASRRSLFDVDGMPDPDPAAVGASGTHAAAIAAVAAAAAAAATAAVETGDWTMRSSAGRLPPPYAAQPALAAPYNVLDAPVEYGNFAAGAPPSEPSIAVLPPPGALAYPASGPMVAAPAPAEAAAAATAAATAAAMARAASSGPLLGAIDELLGSADGGAGGAAEVLAAAATAAAAAATTAHAAHHHGTSRTHLQLHSPHPHLPTVAEQPTPHAAAAPPSHPQPPAASPFTASQPPPPPPAPGVPFISQWDDARNPMSLYYDPTLDRDQQAHRHPQQQQQQLLQQLLQQHQKRSDADAYLSGAAAPSVLVPVPAPAAPELQGQQQQQQPPLDAAAAVAAARQVAGDGPMDGAGGASAGDGSGGTADGDILLLDMKGGGGGWGPAALAAAAAAAAAAATAAAAGGGGGGGGALGPSAAAPLADEAAEAARGPPEGWRQRAEEYFVKWRGVSDTLLPPESAEDIAWSWLGAFLAICAVALMNQYLSPEVDTPLMVASFGASAVLLFGVPASKLGQPRNLLGGQVFSAIVGCLVRLAFRGAVPQLLWLSSALGMSIALAVMQVTRTVHPPGGATALIAASARTMGDWYGFKLVLTVFFGSLAMLAVALAVNNIPRRRRYPTYWLGA